MSHRRVKQMEIIHMTIKRGRKMYQPAGQRKRSDSTSVKMGHVHIGCISNNSRCRICMCQNFAYI